MEPAALRPAAASARVALGRARLLAWVEARGAEAALLALAAALVTLTAARLPAAFESGNALNHVSGAWMTLADDLSRGTFYRPLLAPELGFGGTRFFPLAFVLHAGLLRLGVPLLAAGYALSAAAGALLLAASFLLLRRLGLRAPAAASFAALTLAGFAGQHALSAVRGDLLAVALEALGLALVATAAAGRRPAGREVLLSAVAFTLAFAAKPTALVAPAAAAAFLALRGDRRAAVGLALLVAGGAAGVTLATDALSEGRFLALLAACASGGAGPGDLLRAPLRLVRAFVVGDRAGLLLLAAAALALLLGAPRGTAGWRARGAAPLLLSTLWLAAAMAGLLVVMASPGTGVNHLLEVEVASAVVLGAAARAEVRRGGRAARRLGALAAVTGAALVAGLWREDLRSSRLAELRAIAAAAPDGPLLSEDPLVPLMAGARPSLLDPWMLRLAAERDPALARPLLSDLRTGGFAAVILFQDLAGPEAAAWYAHGNLGPAPVEEIRAGYRLAARVGRYHLYVPAAPRDAEARGRVVLAGPARAPRAPPLDWTSPAPALDSGPHAPALPDRPGRAVAAPGASP